ncbi:thiosulfate oxidation carrier protein SoxY, partial [Melaminivora alkalimesophila]
MQRRTLIASALALPATSALARQAAAPADPLAPNPAELRRAMEAFTQGRTPLTEGLELQVPALADNPGAVPLKVRVGLPITDEDWCEEIIVLAERNPSPLACRLRFTPAAGAA